MEYRRLGKSGLPVSALSLGSWVTFGSQVDVDSAVEMMSTAYEAGVNFFDNAEVYARGESERIMGRALQKLNWPRDSYCVSSKVWWGSVHDPKPTQRGLHRKHIFEACHQAMQRLQVDYLDMYFCHRPDPETPIEETVRAMHDLVSQGKVMYWGTSEWSAQEIMQAHMVARQQSLIPPTMEQPQYNMFWRERVEKEYARLYEEVGMGTTIWSPLYSGLLTGKYNDGIPHGTRLSLPGYEWLRKQFETEKARRQVEIVKRLTGVADDLGITMPRLAIAWCLKNPHVSTVILGASRKQQLEENLKAIEDVKKLFDDVMQRIESLLESEA